MSAPPSRNRDSSQPTPLNQRARAQNSSLGIRIVPYSPPRLSSDGGRTVSQTSSHAYAAEASSGNYGDPPSSGPRSNQTSWGAEHYPDRPGSALSPTSTISAPLAGDRGHGVSGSKPAGDSSSAGTARRLSPSEVANVDKVYAPARTPSQGSRYGESSRPASASSVASTTLPRPLSRRRNFVAVHADHTFSLVRGGPQSTSQRSVISPPPQSFSSRTSSSHERPSIDAWSDDRSSSFLTGTSTTIPDHGSSRYTPSPSSSTTQLAEDPIIHSSPWNYRMVGGLRKVQKTPDLKQKATRQPATAPPDSPLPPLPEIGAPRNFETPSRSVVPKSSFASDETTSTTSDTTNYKVYGHSLRTQASADSLIPSSDGNSNYEILGASSPAPHSSSPVGSPGSTENYVLHGEPSFSSLVTVNREPRLKYSQESLVVPPLRPVKKKTSAERLEYFRQRSKESLRARAESLKSIRSIKSISSVISQESARALFAAPALLSLRVPQPFSGQPFVGRGGGTGSQSQHTWAALQGQEAGSSAGPSRPSALSPQQRIQMLEEHPHQWSSQLSTVMSESEGGSSRSPSRSLPSRSLSYASSGNGNGHRRQGSSGWASSQLSGRMRSMSSGSLAARLEEGQEYPEYIGSGSGSGSGSGTGSGSRSDPIERPQQAFYRAGGPSGPPMVRDPDEHGDGLADLRQVTQQHSKSGLSGFFSSSESTSRGLHSSASTSSKNGSMHSVALPTWARLYYGSGEHRWLPASFSDLGDSRPGSRYMSTNPENFPSTLFSQRRRAQQMRGAHGHYGDTGSMDILPAGQEGWVRTLKRKTSSIWSPHLRTDRRASRFSMWEPPSVSWSADSGPLGRRNVQVILFIMGFVFPIAWILAAFLPLPPQPPPPTWEKDPRKRRFDPDSRFTSLYFYDETRYESAKWWRNLNRFMAIVGVLIIAAIVALVVLGVRQGWMMGRT